MFSEPAAGGGAREEMVCVVLSGSEITSRVRVQARWSDVTATGSCHTQTNTQSLSLSHTHTHRHTYALSHTSIASYTHTRTI